MYILDLTLDLAADNVALDEALLLHAEDQQETWQCLRLWEPRSTMVVVGRGSTVEREVSVQACQRDCVPIIRRTSGGSTIVTGPGCLMYALVLGIESHPELKSVSSAYSYLLPKIARAIRREVAGVGYDGISDLVVERDRPRKFSGNSLPLPPTTRTVPWNHFERFFPRFDANLAEASSAGTCLSGSPVA